MTSFKHIAISGNAHHLLQHFIERGGRPETMLVGGELYLSPDFGVGRRGLRVPDLLVAFDVDIEAYYRSNAYVISEQGKPPDFVLEVASPSTARVDTGVKREAYAALGVGEYWRFDETGRLHGARLAGDRLVEGEYEPLALEELSADAVQGYSAALDLHLRWERGELVFVDPATERRILSYEDQRLRADEETAARIRAEAQLDQEEAARVREEAARERAEAAREQAEARVRELERQLEGRSEGGEQEA